MTRILLDTSAYSAFRKGHAGVLERIQQAEEIVVNPIVLGELRAGFGAGGRYRRNETDLSMFLSSPRVTAVVIDEETASRYAAIMVSLRSSGSPLPTNDVWIAATAMQHGLSVVTTDTRFRSAPQILVELFDSREV